MEQSSKSEQNAQAAQDAEIANELMALAQSSVDNVRQLLPQDGWTRFAIFVEACRIVDVLTVFGPMDQSNEYENIDIQLIQWGWNLAAATLLSPLEIQGGIPMSASTGDTRVEASNLLRSFGCVVHVRRVAEMVRGGMLDATRSGGNFRFKLRDPHVNGSYADNIAFDWMRRSAEDDRAEFGSELDQWNLDNIESKMLPLIRPWETKFGTMATYDAVQEVDDHFLAIALEAGVNWRTEAGIHPDGVLGGVKTSLLTAIATYFISFHVKHAQFVQIGAKEFPEIGIHQSMTIWKERSTSIETLVDQFDISPELANQAIDALALKADEAQRLEGMTSSVRPLLIDLGNGFDLWVVSSLWKNPFHSIREIQEWRNPDSIGKLAEKREEWLRTMIQGLFEGTRYIRVEGAIKVRIKGKIVTDIDAAVYDTVDDELALFQIKWQDFNTNDPKQLRSKASNFFRGMRKWSKTIKEWVEAIGIDDVVRAMRFERPHCIQPIKVFLFGLSYSASRVDTLTKDERPSDVAIANWPQFVRARHEIGPVERVVQKLHDRLLNEARPQVVTKPLPMAIELCGRRITLDDVFHSIGQSAEVDGPTDTG
jgi:hypothetical protein